MGGAGKAREGFAYARRRVPTEEERCVSPIRRQKGGEADPPEGASDQREIPRREGLADRER